MDIVRAVGLHAAMITTTPNPPAEGAAFGDALRDWRRARGVSQLDLALTTEISARHLSFLETGRARPSREMAHRLAEALMLPRAERNVFLAKAGFAPVYPATPLGAESLDPFRAILAEMMERHAPNPALVCNKHWTVLEANPSAQALLSAMHSGPGEMNVIRMLTETAAAAEIIENLGEVLAEMTGRIRLEALEAGSDPVLESLLVSLAKAQRRHPAPAAVSPRRPVVPVIIRAGDLRLRFLTAVAHFGTSEDVTVRDLRLELLFPADEATRVAMRALGGQAAPQG